VTPPRPPAQLLEPLIRALLFALEAQTQSPVHRLARPLMSLILHRIIVISHLFRRVAERIAAGRPFPRRRGAIARPGTADTPGGAPGTPRKPPADPLPRRQGWLGFYLPEIVLHRGQLSQLLATPEMAALIEAAPVQMGRVLRPLCRMLGLKPPPAIAPPPRRRPVRQPRPRPPEPRWPHDPRTSGFTKGPPFLFLARASRPPRRKPA
jgi:hypothetical protein